MEVQLRKQRRDEQLSKRRNIDAEIMNQPSSSSSTASLAQRRSVEDWESPEDVMLEILADIDSLDDAVRLSAVTKCRKLISGSISPPCDAVIAAGLLDNLVAILNSTASTPQLLLEAAWALTNIASGTSEQTAAVYDAGALPALQRLLDFHGAPEVQEQAVWAMGNIAGDNEKNRDLVIKAGLLGPVCLLLLNSSTTPGLVRQCTWFLSNLCRGKKPRVCLEDVQDAIPCLAMCLDSVDPSVVSDAAWAFSYLSDGDGERIEAVIKSGVVKRLVSLLGSQDSNILGGAVRTLGNLVTGDDYQTQRLKAVLEEKLLMYLKALLERGSTKPNLMKEVCWAISNVTAGTRQQIQAVLDLHIVPQLVYILGASEFKVRKEAAWALVNMSQGGNRDQMRMLVESGAIAPLCDLLTVTDPDIIRLCLLGIEHILKAGFAEQQVRKEAAWALVNMSQGGNRDQMRMLVESGAIAPLCDLLTVTDPDIIRLCLLGIEHILKAGFAEQQVRKEAAWALVNMSQGGNRDQMRMLVESGAIALLCDLLTVTDPDIIRLCLLGIEHILKAGFAEQQVRKEAAWALVNMSQGGNRDQMRMLVESGAIAPLCDLLTVTDPDIIRLCLLGIEHILKAGFAEQQVRKEAAWALVNMSQGGNRDQMRMLVESGAIALLCDLLTVTDPDIIRLCLLGIEHILKAGFAEQQVRKEAAWALVNMSQGGNRDQMRMLVESGAIAPLCDLLTVTDPDIIRLCLLGIEHILKAGFAEQQVRKEAAWALVNMSQGGNRDQMRMLVESGAIALLCDLLTVTDPDIIRLCLLGIEHILKAGFAEQQVRKEAAWALVNMSQGGNRDQMRMLVESGAIAPLCDLLTVTDPDIIRLCLPGIEHILKAGFAEQQVRKEAAWALVNMSQGGNRDQMRMLVESGAIALLCDLLTVTDPDIIRLCLPGIEHILKAGFAEQQVRKEAAWALVNMSQGGNRDQMRMLVESGAIAPLCDLLTVTDPDIIRLCLLGIEHILKAGFAEQQVRKEAAWALVNMSQGGNRDQMRMLVESGAIAPLCDLLTVTDPDIIRLCLPGIEHILKAGFAEQQVRKEAAWALVNMSQGGNRDQMRMLVESGAIAPLCDLLTVTDPDIIRLCLLGIEHILKAGFAEQQVRKEAAWALVNMSQGGNRDQMRMLVESGAIALLCDLLTVTDPDIIRLCLLGIEHILKAGFAEQQVRKEAAWALVNMSQGGNRDQMRMLVESGAIAPLCDLLTVTDPDIIRLCLLGIEHILKAGFAEQQVRKEAAWALVNMSQGGNRDQMRMLVESGAIALLCDLLTVTDPDIIRLCLLGIEHILKAGFAEQQVRKEAAWALVNMSQGGNRDQMRMLVESGAIAPLCDLLTVTDPDIIRLCLPGIEHILKAGFAEQQVRKEAAWALVNMSQGGNRDQMRMLVESGAIALLCDLLTVTDPDIIRLCLLGIEHILKAGFAEQQVRKEAAWALVNMSQGGNRDQMRMLVESGAIAPLCDLLTVTDPDIIRLCLLGIEHILKAGFAEQQVRKEAAWALVNMSQGGNRDQMRMLVESGAIAPLCDLLTVTDPDIIRLCLPGIEHILKAGFAEQQVRKEAAWALVNMSQGGNRDQMRMLVESGAIAPLCDLLTVTDPDIIRLCLLGIEHITQDCERPRPRILTIHDHRTPIFSLRRPSL